jgi:hypothetical protein
LSTQEWSGPPNNTSGVDTNRSEIRILSEGAKNKLGIRRSILGVYLVKKLKDFLRFWELFKNQIRVVMSLVATTRNGVLGKSFLRGPDSATSRV